MRRYETTRVFPECKACGHPWISHAEGSCFCGCTGGRSEPDDHRVETTVTVAPQHAGHRDGWSREEDGLLAQRYREGTPISRLSSLHERRPGAIITRLEQLGLITPRRRVS